MSDSCQENRPLLCDDYLDEEFHIEGYSYQRRYRPSLRSGRARYHAKGAAAIIAHWPDNCSTSVAYWWLGVVMLAVTVFVIYNCVLIFGMVPKPNTKPFEYRFFNNIKRPTQLHSRPDVFMHLIVNNNTDVHLNKLLPYVKLLSQKHPNYKYTFLVLANDTSKDMYDFNDEKRNSIALDSLWTHGTNFKNQSKYKQQNVSVEFLSLTTYLNESPIKKFWRNLPSHIIEFLVRSVSVWDKGGISFNPVVLTPESSNQKYSEIIHDLLIEYEKPKGILTTKSVIETSTNYKRRPNNIQDIINALSKEDIIISQNDLNVADNNEVSTVLKTKDIFRKRRFTIKKPYHNNEVNQTSDSNEKVKESYNNSDQMNNNMNSNKIMLPLILKHLFSANNSKDLGQNMSNNLEDFKQTVSPTDTMISQNTSKQMKRNSSEESSNLLNLKSKKVVSPEISIDTKGNIIASKIACHAFLGTIYSNAYRHAEEKTITDFVMSELSLFCNGLLSSCEGINVIIV